jgi:hypothetical protein
MLADIVSKKYANSKSLFFMNIEQPLWIFDYRKHLMEFTEPSANEEF